MTWQGGKRHRVSYLTLFVLAGVIAGMGGFDLARGHLHAGLTELLTAAMTAIAAVFCRLNWRLIELNRDLIDVNRALLERAENTGSRWP